MAKQEKATVNNENELLKLIKLVVIVSLIFVLFYVITIFVNKEEPKNEEVTKTPASIQYDEILIGNLLEQPNDEYYVLVYDTEDSESNVYLAYLSNYSQNKKALRYYTAELNNPLNAGFVGEEANFKIKKITELKLTGPVLFKIKKGKISQYYEDTKIKETLQELTKAE